MEFPDGVEIKDSGTFRINDWGKYVGFFKLKAERELEAERDKVRVLREAAEAMRKDLLMRADSDNEGLKVVACGSTVWRKFQDALQATAQGGSENE